MKEVPNPIYVDPEFCDMPVIRSCCASEEEYKERVKSQKIEIACHLKNSQIAREQWWRWHIAGQTLGHMIDIDTINPHSMANRAVELTDALILRLKAEPSDD